MVLESDYKISQEDYHLIRENIEQGFLLSDALLHFPAVCSCLHMGGIHEDLCRINQFKFIIFGQYMGKYLLKQIRIFETSGIVFPKSRKMRNLIRHIQTKKPAVCYIYLDFFYCLAHTFNTIKILDQGNFNQLDGTISSMHNI